MNEQDLLDWNWITTNRHRAWPRLVCQHLRARMVEQPDAEILSVGDRTVVVEELVRMVASVGANLMTSDESTPVVTLVDRSVPSVAALFGVQWSGRTLIPMSVDDPVSRMREVVERLGDCEIVDATGRGPDTIAGKSVCRMIEPKEIWVEPAAPPADAMAMIVFTSGSTGKPKGIVRLGWQEDCSLVRYKEVGKGAGRVAVFGPLHWLGGLSMLRNGVRDGFARLIAPVSLPADQLLEDLSTHRIEMISATPSLITSLARSSCRKIESLSLVSCVGEPLNPEVICSARQLGTGGVSLRSRYGASEILGPMAHFQISPDDDIPRGVLPLGAPAPGIIRLEHVPGRGDSIAQIFVDRWVSQGYWDDPALQASRYGTTRAGDPFWRTGDLVRESCDGTLWYVGRVDDMVKISGRLVEPAESARVLSMYPGIRATVVVPRALADGRQQLVAHVEAEPKVSVDDVRRHLRTELPSHVVPAILVRHEALPIATGGKVDRQALMKMPVVPWRSRPVTPPMGQTEQFVVQVACRLLGLEEISRDDDLWSLGLDSLGAVELSEILARQLNPSMTVNDFIDASTPAQIASVIERSGTHRRSQMVPLVPTTDPPSVLIMTGGGAPALSYRELACAIEGHGVVAFEQWGLNQRTRPDRTVGAAASRNLECLRAIALTEPLVLIGHSWGGLVAHEMACQLRASGQDCVLVLLDSGRGTPRQGRDRRPATLRVRSQPWIQHLMKLLYWRFHRVLSPLVELRRVDKRNQRLFRFAARQGRRHLPGRFGGPMLVVQARGSSAGEYWMREPHLQVVKVEGGHRDLIHPPYVEAVVDVIKRFLNEYQEVPTPR